MFSLPEALLGRAVVAPVRRVLTSWRPAPRSSENTDVAAHSLRRAVFPPRVTPVRSVRPSSSPSSYVIRE